MTHLLDQAIEELHKLPAERQNELAQIILDELADERRWEQTFANGQDTLAGLAAKARADIEAGKVVHKGMDEV